VVSHLRVITRNYELKLLRGSRNYDVDVSETMNFYLITIKKFMFQTVAAPALNFIFIIGRFLKIKKV
jgi:hypothetical protein